MATCPACHSEIGDDARFCPDCGAHVPHAADLPTVEGAPAARALPPRVVSGEATVGGATAPPFGAVVGSPGGGSQKTARMSTFRFSVLAGLLLGLIAVIVGVLVVVTHSSHRAAAPVAATSSTASTQPVVATVPPPTDPAPTVTAAAVTSDLAVSFAEKKVVTNGTAHIFVRELHGLPISSATLLVDGVPDPSAPKHRYTHAIAINWIAPARNGSHELEVDARVRGGKTQAFHESVAVVLPPGVQQAMNVAWSYVAAIDSHDARLVQGIQIGAQPNNAGYLDAHKGHIFYLSSTSSGPNIFDLHLAYVEQQVAEAPEPEPGPSTAFFCVIWEVNLNLPGAKLRSLPGGQTIEQRRELHPLHNDPQGNAPRYWVPFDQYASRLWQCG